MTKSPKPHLINRSWLDEVNLKALLAALNTDGEETRIVGGAVRNALLGEEIADIDCATTAIPSKVERLAAAAGFRTVPTGIEHGTVTVLVNAARFEVTTLRADVETDGRHAVVAFGRDFAADSARRDFTINALSIDGDGAVHDPLGGYADLVNRVVRFIGDPETRIREDYLRTLRFFRFFAYYGDGRPDRDALRAIVRTRDGLSKLSVERVWMELKKILSAPEPERAILWMRTTEVLTSVLPENWGLDQFHWLLAAERDQGWERDAMLRLEAMLRPVPENVTALADRLKLSNEERHRLLDWVEEVPGARKAAGLSEAMFAKQLYRSSQGGLVDALAHEFARRFVKEEDGAKAIADLILLSRGWHRPVFPVTGDDLIGAGLEPGPKLGAALGRLEDLWIDSGFTLSKPALLAAL